MRKLCVGISLLVLCLVITSPVGAGENARWGYSGSEGPAYWGELDPKYAACKDGKNQSPLDLTGMVASDLSPLTIDYRAGGYEILNNGHAIQVNYEAGSSLTVEGHQFELKQFHFHHPSENWIDGQSFPMEAHFVHADADGNLAVIALMFTAGENNPELEKAWARMPGDSGQKAGLTQRMDAKRLLPSNPDYYRFNGSLTTPPCSEGVWWLVMKAYNSASKAQIEKFADTLHHPNNRPIQPVNARPILK